MEAVFDGAQYFQNLPLRTFLCALKAASGCACPQRVALKGLKSIKKGPVPTIKDLPIKSILHITISVDRNKGK
jgi:hypothetical protein